MYVSESQEHLRKTLDLVAASNTEIERPTPAKATMQKYVEDYFSIRQSLSLPPSSVESRTDEFALASPFSINLFRRTEDGDRLSTTTGAHFRHTSGAPRDRTALLRRKQRERDEEIRNRNRSSADLSNDAMLRERSRSRRTAGGQDEALSYDAAKIKSLMEKKTSLW